MELSYACPKCGGTQLKVGVTLWANLVQNTGDSSFGTEIEHSNEHEWDNNSATVCRDCGFSSIAELFLRGGQTGVWYAVDKRSGETILINPVAGRVRGVVDTPLHPGPLPDFLNDISERLIGTFCLCDISYRVIGVRDGINRVYVAGEAPEDAWEELLGTLDDNEVGLCYECAQPVIKKASNVHNNRLIGTECCWDPRLKPSKTAH